jgi:hypothetical protein
MKVFLFMILTFSCITNKIQAQDNIKITDEQTKAVFNFLFGGGQASELTITDDDKNHALTFIKELVEKTCAMSIISGLNDFSGSLSSVVKSIATSINGCEDAKNGKYSETIRKGIAYDWAESFKIRKQTGEW